MQHGVTLQLFHQPSLSAAYMRNNRAMNANDLTLMFPQIPLTFKLSSDLASGWSKLIYEQMLLNKNQQRIELEIQGPGEKEAFIVEECVKLLFGFKIEVFSSDVWQFLKVADLLGITQSPLNECVTVQEQLLSFAKEHLDQVNIIEGWDYTDAIVENGGEGFLVHRSEIRGLCKQILESVKEVILESKFEILINYAHNLDQSQSEESISHRNQERHTQHQNVKFLIKDLKREHYIQLRSLFFNFINSRNTEMTSNQNIVKVLFEELDSTYELDGYINKQIDNVNAKLNSIDTTIAQIVEKYDKYIAQLNVKFEQQIDILNKEKVVLQEQIALSHQKIDLNFDMTIVCQSNFQVFCYSNGIIKVKNLGVITSLYLKVILCVEQTKEHIIVGMNDGSIIYFDKALKQKCVLIAEPASQPLKLHIYNNYLLSAHQNAQLVIWWNEQLLYQQQYQHQITCLYSHPNFGSFVLLGDSQGKIIFIYLNETKPKLAADTIKQFKNNTSSVLKLAALSQMQELLVSAHQDSLICLWNWEQEQLTSVVRVEQSIQDIHITYNSINPVLRVLSQNGFVSDYTLDLQNNLIDSIFVVENPLEIVEDDIITKHGQIYRLADGPTCLSQYHLAKQCQLSHHLETCIYGLMQINYPQFASSADDKTIVLFNLRSQEKLILRGHQAYVRALALLQGEKHVISGSYDSSIKIWEISTGLQFNTLNGHTKPVLCIQVLHYTPSICVSGGEDAVVRGWNWRNGTNIWKVEQNKNEIWSLLAINNYQTVLSGTKDGQIRVINTGPSGEKSNSVMDMKIHRNYVNCMCWLEETIIASGSSDFNIAVVDFKSGNILRVLSGHSNIVWSIQRVEDDYIASSSTEGKVKIWNWRRGVCVNSQVVCKGSVYVLLRVPHTKKMIGGTATGEVIQWKLINKGVKQAV